MEKVTSGDTGAGAESSTDLKSMPIQSVMQSEIAEEDEENAENGESQATKNGNDEKFLNVQLQKFFV
jgi:hypothetical protein